MVKCGGMKSQRQATVSIIIPCLNEEGAIGRCVAQIFNFQFSIFNKKIKKEIIVVDNGSTDRSAERAKKAGAKVIFEPRKGYGRALLSGLNRATGDYLIFADGDGSYDFRETNYFFDKLLNGYDLVIGSRLNGKIEKNAMPFLHRYFGTPIINFLFRIFFKQKVSDINSGFRGITKKAFDKLRLYSTGMEFASEMLYKACKSGLRITEVPVTYHRRIGQSKLSSFRDAWRHLKFMLLFSPGFLFVLPGGILGGLGGLGVLWLLPGKQFIMGRYFDIHTMIVSAFMVLLGFQIVFLGLFAKVFAVNFLEEKDVKTTGILSKITLEKGVAFGCLLLAIGCLLFTYVFVNWWIGGFGALNMERLLIFGMTILVLGVEIIFSSFFFGLLGREER